MERWVWQEDEHGCGIACAAMLTGKPYQQVRDAFAPLLAKREVTDRAVEEYLIAHGFSFQRLFGVSALTNEDRDPWPPAPFADLHLCVVSQCEGSDNPYCCGHMVVLLADGTVLDPTVPQPKRLDDYRRVLYVSAALPPAGVTEV